MSAFVTLKIAVFVPMPMASEAMMTNDRLALRRSVRTRDVCRGKARAWAACCDAIKSY
jgi:hypothetical protein